MNRVLFVPTLVDGANHNAQVNNARAILAGWDQAGWRVRAHAYQAPDQRLAANARIEITRLWRRRAWLAHLFLRYLKPCDLVFYPGGTTADLAGLRWRRRLGRSAPVIATLEGLVGNARREADYSIQAGHPVHCQHVADAVLGRLDALYGLADHIIAISPFLARMGRTRFGDKLSVLPLGIDTGLFHRRQWTQGKRLRVVSAGSVKANKRPALFFELARLYPQADFVWYGEGDLRAELRAQAEVLRLGNLSFPGALPAAELAEAFRAADVFVLPSQSEGVPKVTQEAAACGLAQVIFGYYEAPTVVDGQNGFVVWDDAEFFEKVGQLLDNLAQVEAFGRAGAEMALAWAWPEVARGWRERLVELAERP